jgi:regulator of replication initiation timing
LASPEKMIKMLLEEIHQIAAPLANVVQNQQILIIQNKQLIELLEQIRVSLVEETRETEEEDEEDADQ